jgi:hypothetical protein
MNDGNPSKIYLIQNRAVIKFLAGAVMGEKGGFKK